MEAGAVNIERVENPGERRPDLPQAGGGGGSNACCHCHHDTVAEMTPDALRAMVRELVQAEIGTQQT
jgi:hypothetical protein